ncbi:MAG: hypothetical protein JO148_14230 [Acidimicrobiia bacterium]|nr:hypothetical protein [Acidimicrobiia bacterium]
MAIDVPESQLVDTWQWAGPGVDVERPRPLLPLLEPEPAPSKRSVVRAWFVAHRRSIIVLAALVSAVGVVHAWGMTHYPSPLDDEGTYTAQAWAVQHLHRLAHYTYTYDHPPVGWITLAPLAWVARVVTHTRTAIDASRFVVLVYDMVSAGLVFVLARRLGLRRTFAAAAVMMFAFAPVALTYHRFVYLDNLATPWVLGAFVLALSPRRHLAATAGCALCFVVAVLTKETTLVLLPSLVYQLWQWGDPRTRKVSLAMFATLLVTGVALYPLFAFLKNELFPGHGHVSLLGSLVWQVFTRPSSGSVFRHGSSAQNIVRSWLGLDPWLLFAGVVFLPAAWLVKSLRPLALAGTLLGLTLLRPGYLPIPFVIMPLAIAPILLAGVADGVYSRAKAAWTRPKNRSRRFLGVAAVAGLVGLAGAAVPAWGAQDHRLLQRADADHYLVAEQWVIHHLSHQARIASDDSFWLDLVRAGWRPENVIWHDKLDVDPAVDRTLPNGWRSLDYVILTSGIRSELKIYPMPSLRAAVAHSHTVAAFGPGGDVIEIRKVDPAGP